MVIRITAIVVMAFVVLTTPASATYETGLYAYSAGDFDTAHSEWLPLAEAGDARSQYQLGQMYLKGEGVEADAATALKWFRLSADQDYSPSLFNLAELYYTGRGVAHNHDEAARLYGQAARQGNPEAQYVLGTLYIHGDGVVKDLVRAHMWLSLAGMRGLNMANDRRDTIEAMMTAAQITEAEKLRDQRMGSN